MSQAYPQFTPVQILEAGQRAHSEGRTDYAAQFFQHLIEHYGDTAEAATARETMALINSTVPSGQKRPSQGQPVYRNGGSPVTAPPAGSAPSPGYAASAAVNGAPQGIQLSVNGANGSHQEHAMPNASLNGAGNRQLNGHTNGANGHPNGYGPTLSAPDHYDRQSAPMASQRHHDPSLGQLSAVGSANPEASPPLPTSLDIPRHMRRHGDAAVHQPPSGTHSAPASQRLLVPAPEKNYIIGRVIAGLLLLIGIVGILAGIFLVYGALTDPRLFTALGIATSGQAILFAGSVFVASVVALISSQMATAIFDGVDAVSDLARLERYKFGESDED